jgi:hypothetical protein
MAMAKRELFSPVDTTDPYEALGYFMAVAAIQRLRSVQAPCAEGGSGTALDSLGGRYGRAPHGAKGEQGEEHRDIPDGGAPIANNGEAIQP